MKEDFTMVIKVLGLGCANCKKLEANVREAVKELGIEATIEKVQDFKDIMAYGVMKTPALVVDEQVKVMGRVPSVEDIKKYL
jgi:small redox-active disulfide protein 2